MRAPRLALAVAACLACSLPVAMAVTAPPAYAQTATGNFGRITAYNRPTIRLYDANGRALDQIPRNNMPANATIVDMRSGGGLGIIMDGEVVYLRGIDVEFELNQAGSARCAPASSSTRAEGQISTGTYAGGGSSTDCRLGG